MENTLINGEGNVGMSTQDPNERLHIHCNTTNANHTGGFIFYAGHIGIGTPHMPKELDIHSNEK
jgi:hypothetical protein